MTILGGIFKIRGGRVLEKGDKLRRQRRGLLCYARPDTRRSTLRHRRHAGVYVRASASYQPRTEPQLEAVQPDTFGQSRVPGGLLRQRAD